MKLYCEGKAKVGVVSRQQPKNYLSSGTAYQLMDGSGLGFLARHSTIGQNDKGL